jgi:hypothetical protein
MGDQNGGEEELPAAVAMHRGYMQRWVNGINNRLATR